jgi:hypothetical protein
MKLFHRLVFLAEIFVLVKAFNPRRHSPFYKGLKQSQISQVSFNNYSRDAELGGGYLTNVFDTIFQWNILDFEFPPGRRQQAIDSGEFIPENNVPLGIAATSDRVFVTTPRWLEGVPVSLSVIQLPAYSLSPRLVPYPDWSEHTSPDNPDCTKLMSVYRAYVDECNRLWVIDSGIINALSNLNQVCLPKVVSFDLATNRKVFSYEFPSDQVKQDSLHTNLLVDIRNGQCDKAFIYVSDVWRNGLLVIDMNAAQSWRTTNFFYNPNPHASNFQYKGINFQWTDGVFGTSLGRIFDDRILYFHPMSSHNVSILQNILIKYLTLHNIHCKRFSLQIKFFKM